MWSSTLNSVRETAQGAQKEKEKEQKEQQTATERTLAVSPLPHSQTPKNAQVKARMWPEIGLCV